MHVISVLTYDNMNPRNMNLVKFFINGQKHKPYQRHEVIDRKRKVPDLEGDRVWKTMNRVIGFDDEWWIEFLVSSWGEIERIWVSIWTEDAEFRFWNCDSVKKSSKPCGTVKKSSKAFDLMEEIEQTFWFNGRNRANFQGFTFSGCLELGFSAPDLELSKNKIK